MWIYLLRHGIAEEPAAGRTDEERALTEDGVARLQRSAKAWRKLLEPPDVVLCSPLRRALQTADVLSEVVGKRAEPRIERELSPHGRPSHAIALLEAEMLARTESVAVVGHEPHLGYLLGNLLTGQQRISMPLKKGMLVAVEAISTTSLVCALRWSLTHKAAARLA